MASIKMILPPQPHYLSGYSGFVSGYKFHHGRSYGGLTHDLFMDPDIKRSKIPVLSDLSKDQCIRPTREDEEIIEKRCNFRECKYSVGLIPGYDGHVPCQKEFCGKKYSVETAMGISMFEQMKRPCSCSECSKRQQVATNELDRFENINDYSFPFKKVPGGIEKFKEMYESHLPMPPSGSPYFIDNSNPHKKFMPGYGGHVPDMSVFHGLSYSNATNSALKSFTTRYLKRKALDQSSSFSAPKTVQKPNNQRIPYEQGMIKNYAGHIPGYKFNVGQTFGDGSKNARNIIKQYIADIKSLKDDSYFDDTNSKQLCGIDNVEPIICEANIEM